MRPFFASFIACGILALPVHAGDQWPRFRGPGGGGISDEKGLPAAPAAGDIAWKTALPGTGHGSPSVWKDRVYVCAGDDATGERRVVCLNEADGSVRWTKAYAAKTYAMHKFNNYGTCTPAVDELGCVVYWAGTDEIILLALSPEGKELWKRNFGTFDSDHGSGTSPVIVGGMVVVGNDQRGASSLLAVDRNTGADRWSVPRQSEAKGTCYGLPVHYEEPGQPAQLIFASRMHGFTGVDPATGKVIWEMADAFPQRVVASPVQAGALVLGVSGEGMGGKCLQAIRPGSADGKRPPERVYQLNRGIPYVPTPLVLDGLLYGAVDGTGVGTCHDAATGAVKWQERLGSGFFGSMVAANGVIYLQDKNGDLVSFRAGASFAEPSRLPLGEISYATPAVANGRLYCRTLGHLVAIGRK